MLKTFDQKIKELEKKKSELDLSFLQLQKKEFEKKLSDLLSNPKYEWDADMAIVKYNEARECFAEITLIDSKIQHLPETYEEECAKINDKINFYKEEKEKVKNIQFYKDTEEWIAEILWSDPLYQYAKETNNKELMQKIGKRSLTADEYDTISGEMYGNLFAPILDKELEKKQPPKKVIILLPEWMSEQIKEELRNNKDIHPEDIESFLKKELKKNAGEIKISHIKNTFKDKANQATEYIRRLIINYPKFKIIDNFEKKSTTPVQSKREKLVSSITQEETEEHKNERIRKDNLLSKLNEIWKIEDLKTRISEYLNLFEELNHSFADRKEFEPYVFDVITSHASIEIEKEIIKTLNWLIQGNSRMEKTWLYKYNVYKFNRGSRRMLAYPNWEIFGIYPHKQYEKIINTPPPLWKYE